MPRKKYYLKISSLCNKRAIQFEILSKKVKVIVKKKLEQLWHVLHTDWQNDVVEARGVAIHTCYREKGGGYKSAVTSRAWPRPFQGPSSYPRLCWWSLIWATLQLVGWVKHILNYV